MRAIENALTISRNVVGIVWVCYEDLKNKPGPYYDLNVLFDGQIDKLFSKKTQPKDHSNYFFIGESFGHELHLFYINATQTKVSKELQNIKGLLKNQLISSERPEVLIIDDKNLIDVKDLTFKDIQVNFSILKNH
ncbi:MAG: hypothetical protein ACPGJV_05640 [Bacteriovoracaceae bacterium]